MRLFHVSEESNLSVFVPQKPEREDLANSPPLVWAINEECLPNFLTPRDCPRVTYHLTEKTILKDKEQYLSSPASKHVVAIEHKWFHRMITSSLYLYEFDTADFYLQDENAGYYVSEKEQTPISKTAITNIIAEQIKHGVELRVLPEIISLGEKIKHTSFAWSLCRM